MHHRVLALILSISLWSSGVVLHSVAAPPPVEDQASLAAPVTKANGAEIAGWLRDLAAPEYAVRRDAFLRLWGQGATALPAVREASSASDQQTAETAKVLELLLKLEIKPQDNEELAEFLRLARSATPSAILSLTEKGHWRLATEFLKTNEAAVTAYRSNTRQELCIVAQSALDQGDPNLAWPVLELLLPPVQRHWIAEHAHVESSSEESTLSVDERALALLFRGEFDKAWALAPSLPVQQRIIFLSGHWQWLQNDPLQSLMLSGDAQSLEGRAQRAAYAYLANDVDASNGLLEKVLEDLKSGKAPEPPPAEAAPDRNAFDFEAGSALERSKQALIVSLLICGEADAVDKLISGDDRREHLMYYASRLEYDRALATFGLSADMSDFETWLTAAIVKLGPSLRQANPRQGLEDFQQLCELSALLVSMGKTAEGLRLYQRLIDVTQHVPPMYQDRTWSLLASQLRQAQFRSHAIAILDQRAADLTSESRGSLFSALYPDWSVVAAALWKVAPAELIERVDPPAVASTAGVLPETTEGQASGYEGRWQLMERLWRFDRKLVTEHQSGAVVESWLKSAFRESSQMEEVVPYAASQLSALALRMGLRDLALTLANSGRGASALADVARATMQKNSLNQAALWWAEALRADPRQHEWLLKYISTCSMIGEADKAQALERSRWLRPLAVERAGWSYLIVANNLEEQGLLTQAREYGQAAFEMLEPDNPQLLLTARIYAEILQELDEYGPSADVHRAANALLLAQPNSGYQMSVIQHFVAQEFLARAVAELESGEVDSALDRIARFERLRPSGIEICEHAYPRLVKNGRQDAADKLLERCSQRMLKHLEQWPNDAGSHNNLAWMYARCDQRLEEALGHAELAVRLSKDAPTYVDTLAEAHFRLGHFDEAIELAERCIQLDPRHHHYRKQLERFRDARRAQGG